MLKLLTAAALSLVASAAIGQSTMSQETTTTKSNPAMTTTRHTTVTKTTMHRHMSNVPMGRGISMARAQRIALNARPGRIVSHRMDMERGGPAYSFNIRSNGRRYEVDVRRRDGRIVENRRI